MNPGDLIGAYRIDAVGTADFAVTHLTTQRPARLRWVSPAGDMAEFVQAARRVCGISAPTVHGLIDAGIEGGRCYLVDGPPRGESLIDHIGRVGALSGDGLLAFAESLFSALVELHNRELYDGALHPKRVRIVAGRACVTEPGVGRLMPALTPPPGFTDSASAGPDADLYAAAALVYFAAHGRVLSAPLATDGTGLARPIVLQLRGCLGLEGSRPKADDVRRTIEAVRAGTLAPDAPLDPNAPASGWLTDATVDPPAPQHFEAALIPDELPTARAPIGVISAPTPAPQPQSVPRPRPQAKPHAAQPPPRPSAKPRASQPSAPKTRPTMAIALAALLLAAGVGGLLIWRQMAPPITPEIDPPTTVATAPVERAVPSVTSVASATSAAPATLDKYAHVTLVAQPGPARFVQVESGTVLCESAPTCQVPIDIDTRIEKDGFTPRVLSGDDLYDQRGNRWTIRLRTLP